MVQISSKFNFISNKQAYSVFWKSKLFKYFFVLSRDLRERQGEAAGGRPHQKVHLVFGDEPFGQVEGMILFEQRIFDVHGSHRIATGGAQREVSLQYLDFIVGQIPGEKADEHVAIRARGLLGHVVPLV